MVDNYEIVHTPTQKISKELEQKIIELYQSGTTYNDIVKILNVGKTSVSRVLRRNSVEKRGQFNIGCLEEIKNGVLEMYLGGELVRHIKDKFNISDYLIQRIVVKSGNTLRRSLKEKHNWTDDEIQDIITRWHNGETQKSIAKDYNVVQTRISKIIAANDKSYKRYWTFHQRAKKPKGRFVNTHGYVVIGLDKDDPYYSMARKYYCVEHRYVMAKHLGRPLESYEQVHHIDGNKQNNDILNLQLMVGSHGNGVKYRCMECGSHKIEPIELT